MASRLRRAGLRRGGLSWERQSPDWRGCPWCYPDRALFATRDLLFALAHAVRECCPATQVKGANREIGVPRNTFASASCAAKDLCRITATPYGGNCARSGRFLGNERKLDYCKVGSATQAFSLAAIVPLASKWSVPGSSLQKLRIPVELIVIGIAVTR